MKDNEKESGHFKLYTYPQKTAALKKTKKVKEQARNLDAKEQSFQDIFFVSINDFFSKYDPIKEYVFDPAQNKRYELTKGSLYGFKTYFDIIRSEYKHIQFISSGSFTYRSEENLEKNDSLKKSIFYANYLGIDIFNIGKSELKSALLPEPFKELDKQFEGAKFTPLMSNLFDIAKGEIFKFKNIQTTFIKKVGKVKVGYIGLISPMVYTEIQKEKLKGVYFQNLAGAIIRHSKELRRKGANIIVAMISGNLDCTSIRSKKLNLPAYKVNFDPLSSEHCTDKNMNAKLTDGLIQRNSVLGTLLKLPPGYLDIVLTSGSDSKVANFINGYPTVQSFAGGKQFSWLKVSYDLKNHKIVTDKTVIFQPVETCLMFLKKTQDCYTKEKMRNIELINAIFLGKLVDLKTYSQ